MVSEAAVGLTHLCDQTKLQKSFLSPREKKGGKQTHATQKIYGVWREKVKITVKPIHHNSKEQERFIVCYEKANKQ